MHDRSITPNATPGKVPTPGLEQATAFLKRLRPGGPWALTAIIPDGGTVTETFAERDEAAMAAFIRQRNADERRNVYYTINPVHGAVHKKPTKKEIAAGEF